MTEQTAEAQGPTVFGLSLRIFLGILGSLAWVFVVVMVPVTCSSWPSGWWCFGPPLSPNEWGDYVAGMVAPLALFWFVVAYRLQTLELHEQRKELALQRKEAHALVEQAELQASAAKTNAKMIRRNAWPRFKPSSGSSGKTPLHMETKLRNYGAIAFELQAVYEQNCNVAVTSPKTAITAGILENGEDLRMTVENTREKGFPARFSLRCKTLLDEVVFTTIYYYGGTDLRVGPPVAEDPENGGNGAD